MAITKAEFIKAMLETAGPLDAPAAVKASPSLPGAFGQHGFGKKAAPAPAATSFALRLVKLLGLKNEQHLPTKDVIIGLNPAADYLPDRIYYWRRSADGGHHTLLLELAPTGLELLANKQKRLFHEFYREQRLEDALHRLIQYTLDGFERGGKDRTADIERGQRGETLVIVSVRDDRIDAKDPDQLVCFGTFRDGTDESSLDSFVISDEARRLATSNRALAEDHLGRIYDRRISKLVTDKWQDAFITRQERDAIRKLREACKVGATPVDIAQAAKTLIQAIAQNHRKASAQQPLVFEPLRADHHIGADPEKAGDADFQNPLAGIVIRDSDAKVLGYVVYCLTGKQDAQQLASTLRKHNAFDNVLFIYPDEGGATLELWQGSRPLVGKLTKSGTRFDGDSSVVTLLSRFFIVSQARVKSAKDLAEQLAKRARFLKAVALRQLHDEGGKGHLSRIYDSFKQGLIADLTEEGFADAFAETVANGLLTARWASRHASAHARFTVTEALKAIPVTNPFLRGFFASLHDIRKENEGALYLWLVDDIVGLLERVDVSHVFDFNPEDEAAGKDPVIHFFEDFLAVYDKEKKVERGVFYTPRPAVSYIVRSVDELLRSEFGLTDGLADTTTWGEMVARSASLKLPDGVTADQLFVQILDPATGTGTFLVEVIDVIYRTLLAKHGPSKIEAEWNTYVPRYLLPRLHGYELLMAPYAIAHMKVALKLVETGYRFGSEERAHIYLTNALEPWLKQLPLIGVDALAHEAAAVNEIKRHKRFTVIIGNPPYAGVSANEGPWIENLLRCPLSDGAPSYFTFNGAPLDESNTRWLNDDYVKFLRLAQSEVANSGIGVAGLITNHSWLDNPTFRGMRQSTSKTFPQIYLLDLHGNAKKKETAPDGTKDDNVFDIQQGVAISLMISRSVDTSIRHADLFGLRREKYHELERNTVGATHWCSLTPDPALMLWRRFDATNADEYGSYPVITDVLSLGGADGRGSSWAKGLATTKDHLFVSFDRSEAYEKIGLLASTTASDSEVGETLSLEDTPYFTIGDARRAIRKGDWKARVCSVTYRPFDTRVLYWHPELYDVGRGASSKRAMSHLFKPNIALVTSRMTKGESFAHAFVSRFPVEVISLSSKTSNNAFVFPLRYYPDLTAQIDLVSRYESLIAFQIAFFARVTESRIFRADLVHTNGLAA